MEMMDRTRFVPWKQWIHLASLVSSLSSSTVLTKNASLGPTSTPGPYKDCRDFLASSKRFLRTKYHGDSGANGRPSASSAVSSQNLVGSSVEEDYQPTKRNWMENGPRYAHESVLVPNPLMAPLEMSWPTQRKKLMEAVEIPLSTTGETSEM
jgi:hypothetical protein